MNDIVFIKSIVLVEKYGALWSNNDKIKSIEQITGSLARITTDSKSNPILNDYYTTQCFSKNLRRLR